MFSGSTTPLGGSLSGSIERYTSGLDGGSLGSSLSGSIELDGRLAGISFAGTGTGSQLSGAATYLSKFEQEMSGVAGLRATGGGEGFNATARLFDLSLGLGGLFCLSLSLSLCLCLRPCMSFVNVCPSRKHWHTCSTGSVDAGVDAFDAMYAKHQRDHAEREQGDGRAQVDSRADFGNSRLRETSDREQDGERVASEGQRGVASHRTFVL